MSALYRDQLPQLDGEIYLTDGGAETSLIHDLGADLPEFAAYPLLESDAGRQLLDDYLDPYLELAQTYDRGFVIDTQTWRANRDWGARLGHGPERLDELNRLAIELAVARRASLSLNRPVVVSGNIGPRGDGYVPDATGRIHEFRDYHRVQVETFADTDADMVCVMTMTTAAEATGVALAARESEMPVVVGITVETDGHLPTGQALGEAIRDVDDATEGWTAYFMVNCAHPIHFESVLDPDANWTKRIGSVRANASTRSHAELDEAPELDAGDPVNFAECYTRLVKTYPHINVLGGCCGTDIRHVTAVADALV